MSAQRVPRASQEGLYWEGEEGVNCGLPIFWVDQKQSSFRVGKRKLKIYCIKKKSGLVLDIAANNLVRSTRTWPSLLFAVV